MIIDLGHRPHRRSRGPDRIGLINRDGRWHAIDAVDLGTIHTIEKLPGVGREGLDVAALALCIQGVEHQRGFARTRYPGHHNELTSRYVEIKVLKVVLSCTAYTDGGMF